MNNETYVECLVSRKPSLALNFLKILLIMLSVAFFIIGFITNIGLIGIGIGAVFAFGAYIAYLNTDIEYEYLYLDKEISIDRIAAKSKRKKIATYEIDRMEVLAPINSYRIDSFKNRQTKDVDYSSKSDNMPDKRYVLYYEGNVKVIFEPSEAMIKAIYNVAPRKVYRD